MCDNTIADPDVKYPEMNRAASPGGTVEPYYFSGLARSTMSQIRLDQAF
jgi:hypothetical protein